MKNLACLFLLFISLSSNLLAQTNEQSLDKKLAAVFAEIDIPGCAMAIVSKEGACYQNAFGYADLSQQKPFTSNTVMNMGSTSKTLIGLAVMKAVEEGYISLDMDVNTVLPFRVRNPRHKNKAITFRHLATHTSGIKDGLKYNLKAYSASLHNRQARKGMPLKYRILFKKMTKNKARSLGEVVQDFVSTKGKWSGKKRFLKAAPGLEENYSNLGCCPSCFCIGVRYRRILCSVYVPPFSTTSRHASFYLGF